MSSSVRVGIIGLGQMGRHHAHAYRAAGAQVVAVCDANPQQAAAFGRDFGLQPCSSFEQLIQTPGLQAVSICTPPHLHRTMLDAALQAGLDVLCEKPLAGTLADAEAIAACAATHPDRVVMVCFFHRFHEPVVRLRELLRTGELGPPLVLRNRFALDLRADARPWIWDASRAGGGAVLNTSVHSIDLYRFLIGEPERIAARVRPEPGSGSLERDAYLVLDGGPDGPCALLEARSYAIQKEYTFSLDTEHAAVEIGWTPPSLRVRTVHDADLRDLPIAAPSALTRIEAGIGHFLECVRQRRTPRATVLDGVRALQIAQAAYVSAAEDRFVACGPASAEKCSSQTSATSHG